MVILVVMSTAWPLRVAGRKRICCATRRASSSRPWPRLCTIPCTITWPLAAKVTRRITSPCTLSCLASLVYWGFGLEMTSRSVGTGPTVLGASATAVGAAGIPAEATLPELTDRGALVVTRTPAEATLPTTPAFDPNLVPLPKPVEPTIPWGATAGPCIPPYGLPMAATVDGHLAFGFGVTPKVSPKWTGFVEGLRRLSCAGMAATISTGLG